MALWVKSDGLAMSALSRITDSSRSSRHVRFVPKADINCRDCDVRSLAGPEPDRQVFAKFKHLLRKAAARSVETSIYAHRMRQLFPKLRLCPNPKSIML